MGETKKNSKATSILKNNPLTSIVKGNIGIIVVLIIMCVAVALATDKFLTTNNIISVLRQISINTYIALGMTLIIILGHIDLSVGSIVAMSGTLTVGFIVNQGLPLGVAIAAGLLVGTAAGFVSGFIVANFKVPAFIITMAMMNIASGIAYVYTGGQSTRITNKLFIEIGTGFIVNQGLPLGVAIAAGLLVGTAAGFVSGFIVANFKVPAFIITMAMMNIASGIAYVYTGGQSTRITNKLFIEIGTGYLFNVIPLPVVYMVVLIILFSFILSKTKFGTYVYAIGGNREAARLSGVPIKKIEIVVFTISGLLSAFAGLVLCSRMYSGQPSVGSGYELDAIAACVLGGTSMTGGKGRISGTVFGAMVIGIISNGLNLIGVSSYWQLIIKGLIIACAVLLDGQKGKLELLKKKKLAAN